MNMICSNGLILQQLATLKIDEGTDALNAIVDRQKELEAILDYIGGDSKRHPEGLKIREQLAGVKLLNDMYLNVNDMVDTLAQTHGDGNKFSARNRAAAINEIIAQHNKQASGSSETIADSPEMREAQGRINARFTEEAKQPQRTETVDDARRKVVEVFGDKGEKEH